MANGRVRLHREGRTGTVRDREGRWRTYDVAVELDGGDAVLLLSAPSPAAWLHQLPWAADRRQTVLERIARELVRLASPGARVVVHAGGIDLLGPAPAPSPGHVPPAG